MTKTGAVGAVNPEVTRAPQPETDNIITFIKGGFIAGLLYSVALVVVR